MLMGEGPGSRLEELYTGREKPTESDSKRSTEDPAQTERDVDELKDFFAQADFGQTEMVKEATPDLAPGSDAWVKAKLEEIKETDTRGLGKKVTDWISRHPLLYMGAGAATGVGLIPMGIGAVLARIFESKHGELQREGAI